MTGNMDTVQIILQHGGCWNENGTFENYKVTGMILSCSTTYETLCTAISDNLELKHNHGKFNIKYKIQEDYPPFDIKNDQNLSFYIELKKKEYNVMKYPLCITIFEDQQEQAGWDLIPLDDMVETDMDIATTSTISEENNLPHLQEMLQITSNLAHNAIQTTQIDGDESLNSDEDSTDGDEYKNEQRIKEGYLFSSKQCAKNAISHYALVNHFNYKVVKSCKKNYFVNCIDKNCSWTFKASATCNTKAFRVRKFHDVHTCPLEIRFREQRQATSSFLSNLIKEKYTKTKSYYGPLNIQEDIHIKYGIDISYNKAWRTKEKATEQVLGKASESYKQLPAFLYMLRKTNPGTFTALKTMEDR